MRFSRVLCGCAIVFGAGCGDGEAPEVFGPSHVQFTYSGPAGGTYDATGELPSIDASITEFAYGQRLSRYNTLRVTSQAPAAAGTHNAAEFDIARLTEGSAIFGTCGLDLCTWFTFTLGIPNGSSAFDLTCALTAGPATITEITPTRARGTFSGTGSCSDGNRDSDVPFTVTEGTFDVDLRVDLP